MILSTTRAAGPHHGMSVKCLRGATATLMAAILGAVAAVSAVQAQDWPTKPVKIVSPFAPGGGSDTFARVVADNLGRQFRQQFVVENRGGAGGLIGSASVAAAAPDGYTFMTSSISTHNLAPAVAANPGYDPVRDFTHVAFAGGPPVVIVVSPSIKIGTFKELLESLKSRTEALPYSSAGPGTLGNLIMEFLAEKEGVKVSHVAYKGAGQAMNDVVAGHVTVGAFTYTATLGQMRGGLVTPLAVSSSRRMPDFPDLPTLKELGYPDLVATTWFGFAGPDGIPHDIVLRMNQGVNLALDSPDVLKRLTTEGFEIEKMSPAEVTAFIRAENAKWGPLARKLMTARPAK